MNSRLVPKTLPKSQSRESLDKVLGIENETWMCFVSCVCLDVPFVCQHICALFLVCASNFAYSENVNGEKAGRTTPKNRVRPHNRVPLES
ncbi:hypothetical protein YC2023_058266 [Brassica napus]